MEKKLKEYASYYIGCRCLNTWFPEGHKEYDKEWKLIGVSKFAKSYGLENEYEQTWTDSIKPILRRLSDMKEGEAIELVRLVVHEDEYNNVSTYRHNYTGDLMVQWGILTPMERVDDIEYFFNATGEKCWSADQFHYLLKQGFDLFGLVDAGLAQDEKELTNKTI